MSGANRVGKTASFYRVELAYHLTGEYPNWWEGRVFKRPVVAWVGSTDFKTNVGGCQKALIGDKTTNKIGIGEIDAKTGNLLPCGLPKDTIIAVHNNPQVANSVLGVRFKHRSGGESYYRFIAYNQGRENLQAGKVNIVGMDEEPPMDI